MKRHQHEKHFPEMVALSIAGKTDKQIGVHYGLNPKTVSSWLNSRTILGLSEKAFLHLKRTRQVRRVPPPRLSPNIFEILTGDPDDFPMRRYGYSGGRAWYRSEKNPNAVSWPEEGFEATLFAIAEFSPQMPREVARECFSERVKRVELIMSQRGPSKRDISTLVDEILRLRNIKTAQLLGKRRKLRRELKLLASELQRRPEDPKLLIHVGVWWMKYLSHLGITNIPRWLHRLYVWDGNGEIVRVAQESSNRAIRLIWHQDESETDKVIAISADIEPDGRIATLTREFQSSQPDGGYTTTTITSVADACRAECRRLARLSRIR
ncbi:hypothetical protein BH09VER1_BH09VER1_47640 [soil metagenome]